MRSLHTCDLTQPPSSPVSSPLLMHREHIEGMGAIVVKADAARADQIDAAMAGIDGLQAVVSTLGSIAEPGTSSGGTLVSRPRSWVCFHTGHGSFP